MIPDKGFGNDDKDHRLKHANSPWAVGCVRWLVSVAENENRRCHPEKAGVQSEKLDSRFRGNDKYCFCNRN